MDAKIKLEPGVRSGFVKVPRSKSHEHRLILADFLAGDFSRLVDAVDDSDDILATKRCLRSLRSNDLTPLLDCGESGTTRRFLGPVAAALGKHPVFKTIGRLADRPQLDYDELRAGVFELPGDVSSQFVSGLLFALPLIDGDSTIRFTTPLQSKGYVEMTRRVLIGAGIHVSVNEDGFAVPGGQVYQAQPHAEVEGDWSGAAFWLAMNALGSSIIVDGLSAQSAQPDRVIGDLASRLASAWKREEVVVDVSDCPDLFPVLSVVAAASAGEVVFTGTRRLRLKESDRASAMNDVLRRFGVQSESEDDVFRVHGKGELLDGGEFKTFGDHRIAMAIAVGATHAREVVELDDAVCVSKSYPEFFTKFANLIIRQ